MANNSPYLTIHFGMSWTQREDRIGSLATRAMNWANLRRKANAEPRPSRQVIQGLSWFASYYEQKMVATKDSFANIIT